MIMLRDGHLFDKHRSVHRINVYLVRVVKHLYYSLIFFALASILMLEVVPSGSSQPCVTSDESRSLVLLTAPACDLAVAHQQAESSTADQPAHPAGQVETCT